MFLNVGNCNNQTHNTHKNKTSTAQLIESADFS